MGALNKLFKRQWPAVVTVYRKNIGRIITPRPFSSELPYWHNLYRIDTKFFKCPKRAETDENSPL